MLDTITITHCLPVPLRIARSEEEVSKACQFRKHEYGKIYPAVNVVTNDPFNEQAYVLYSCDTAGIIKSTASFIVDSHLGLPEDKLFPPQVDSYRRSKKRLMEIGRFVIRDQQNLVRSYYKAAYEVAVRRGIDIILMVIRQKDIRFHQKLIGTEVLSEDIGENFGSSHSFSCLSWDIATTKPAFFKWTAAA